MTNRPNAGFTLLEMLMVIALLAATAGIGLATLGDEDGSQRDNDTRYRLGVIEQAIVGRNTPAFGGEMRLSGFVADMGRLPNTMAELLGSGNPAYATTANVFYDTTPDGVSGITDSNDVATGLSFSAGIRKQIQTGASGQFKDGWGNAFEPTLGSNTISWLSKGRDTASGGGDDQTISIAATDWLVNLASWTVTINNTDSNPHTISIVLISQEAGAAALQWRQRWSADQAIAASSSQIFSLTQPAAYAGQVPFGRHILLAVEAGAIKAKRYVDFYPGTLPAPVTLEVTP
ncbi:type II secretion system protein [Chitinibacter sp. S2-10]|uniref:type II secretion system protein n=1 Tax=Chitinibacter sp. S2-10 TaxID=3373597 RepID=UPI00397727F5